MRAHTRRPGSGPRQAEKLYSTTLELLARHGYDGLTIEGVAAASGVNKTTIYRWWPSKDPLLADALLHSRDLELTVPDTGSLRGDLLGLLGHVRELLTGERTSRAVAAAFAAAASRPALATMVREFFTDRLAGERIVVTRAVERGELQPEVDLVLLLDMMFGALWVRAVLRGGQVGPEFDEQVVDLLLRAVAP